MSEIRTFDLVNSEGEAYNLTIANRYTGFLGEVTGLGYERSPEYQQVGTNFIEIADGINQKVISGVIKFFQPHAYQSFSRFSLFCQDKNLTLYYRTPTGLFMRDGAVTKIDKSEGEDVLQIKIDFTTTSHWYQKTTAHSDSAEITITSDSMIESPCCLAFQKALSAESVTWNQYVDGVQVLTGTLNNITASAASWIYVRTDTNPYEIYKMSGTTKTDLYASSDFSTARFPMIQKGVNTFAVTGATSMKVEGRVLYETV